MPEKPYRPAAENSPILLYDGVCYLCDGTVRFILAREKSPKILFCHLQSDTASAILGAKNVAIQLDTVYLLEQGKLYQRSDAVLRTMRYLRTPWNWLAVFRFVPRPLRDWAYNLVGRNRYRLFGRSDVCMVAPAENEDRFLD